MSNYWDSNPPKKDDKPASAGDPVVCKLCLRDGVKLHKASFATAAEYEKHLKKDHREPPAE